MGRAKQPGLDPARARQDANEEEQRLEALKIVSSRRMKILSDARTYRVSAVAIAGAILWEALENPYPRLRPAFLSLGPGKVHPVEVGTKSEAEKVEDAGRIAPARGASDRLMRLKQPDWAIAYIAAIMSRHAEVYEKTAGVDIRQAPGVLCTLYQGGKSEERAQKLADRRKQDPKAQPMPGDEMGPWVVRWQGFIQALLQGAPAKR